MSNTEARSLNGYYVYGIVEGDGSQPVEGLPEEGIDPAYPVYALQPSAISHQPSAISAIVSKVSLQEFGREELKANLNDIKWVEAKVLAHQRILDQVLAHHTLIPMRFCTIISKREPCARDVGPALRRFCGRPGASVPTMMAPATPLEARARTLYARRKPTKSWRGFMCPDCFLFFVRQGKEFAYG